MEINYSLRVKLRDLILTRVAKNDAPAKDIAGLKPGANQLSGVSTPGKIQTIL